GDGRARAARVRAPQHRDGQGRAGGQPLNDVAGRRPREPVRVSVTYRRLLRYLKPHKGMFALGILGGGVYSASMAAFVWLGKRFGDWIAHPEPRMIFLIPVALVIIFVARGIGNFTQTYCMGYVGRSIVKRLRAEVFR